MNKKKSLIISIIAVVLLILLVVGGTYAYFLATTNEVDVSSGSANLDINYNAPEDITSGSLTSSDDKTGGIVRTATVSLNEGSIDALFNMYITPTALTNLNIAALRWDVEGVRDDETVCFGSGDFSDATVGTPIQVIDSCELSTDEITFNIYIWLDSNLIESAISGANFGASISVDSVPITGDF